MREFFFFFFFFMLINLQESRAEDITAFVYAGCTQAKYQPGSPYQYNVEALLSSLSDASGVSPYANLSSGDASPAAAAVYGLHQCRGDLSAADCQACVRSATAHLSALCLGALGGALQLQGCYVRFAKDVFAGQLDKSIAFQKCSAPSNGDVAGTRESVLDALALAGAAGSYRVASAGAIQGLAQCLGDLGPSQCTDCLATAADAVRANCGLAGSASLYLVKCYVRYWSNRIPPQSIPGYHPESSHIDRTSRIVAIIAGVMAVVVLLYVFVASLKRPSVEDREEAPCIHHGKH
ncbi:plasmodesmata-located protein 6-like [Wolffia australiana]